MTPKEYKQMMTYLTRPSKARGPRNMQLAKVNDIPDAFNPDLEQSEFLRPGETLEDWKPNPFLKPHAEGGRIGFARGHGVGASKQKLDQVIGAYRRYRRGEKNPKLNFKRFFEIYAKENFADGGRAGYNAGQLVTPSIDGSRPGYRGTKVEDNIRLRDNGNAYDVEVGRGKDKTGKRIFFRKSFHLKDYKNKTEALKAARKYKAEKIKIPFKTGKQNPMFGSGLSQKEYNKLYKEKFRQLTDAGKLAKERDLKLKNFIGNKKKIKASVLRDFAINELGYNKYSASRLKLKMPNVEVIKDIKTGIDFKPLTKKQIEIVKENFDLPEGVEKWDFKYYKNGISAAKHPSLFEQIERRLKDKKVYKIAANFANPDGWMMNAMNRLYENETVLKDGKRVLKEGVTSLTYEPIRNKKGIIVGFKDNTAAGKGNIYYGTKKAAKNYGDGAEWRVHGDFARVSKFVNIANGVRAEPDKILQKVLTQKGINVPGLTLNDVLSHQRYYNVLADTAPKALLRRQIVLHHTKGVGAGDNIARAAATKDIQLLTDAINTKVKNLETIVKGTSTTPARKLTNAEKLKLKDWGAKIVDFDGKIVGGGFLDPHKQYAKIQKGAIDYAKGKDFNIKTVNSYLERLGCGKSSASGGRVLYDQGAFGLTECAQKGRNKLDRIVLRGTTNRSEQVLANQILKIGRSLKDITSIKGTLGPAALAFTAAAEAGLVGYDMLAEGKTFREAVGDSIFNYALGPKLKIDSVKERNKRFRELGVSEEDMGKIGAYESALQGIEQFEKTFEKAATAQQRLDEATDAIDPTLFPGTIEELQKNLNEARADVQDLYRGGDPYQKLAPAIEPSGLMALQEAQKLATVDRLTSAGPKFLGWLSPKYEESRQQRILEASAVENPGAKLMRDLGLFGSGFAGGGIAKLAGVSSGPPPESGPNSQGLPGLLKRVRNL